MQEQRLPTSNEYFAAANTYDGFLSYFGEIFDSRNFSAVYVLKGGPGTGKSSFMKRLLCALDGENYYTEAIYCSSDPNSLDGVIAESENHRIAIIDGTSPHERDAVIPGAIDELINLGDCWEASWLRAGKEKIYELNKEKSAAYKVAYSYLNLAGKAAEVIYKKSRSCFDICEAKKYIEKNTDTSNGIPDVRTRLVSSFSRYGEWRLDTVQRNSNKLFSVNGNRAHAEIFMNLLREKFLTTEKKIILCPTALDPNFTDAIYLCNEKIGYTTGIGGEAINADAFFCESPLEAENIKKAGEIRNAALLEAKRWFTIASDLHFRLEEIYTKAMNFDRIDEIYEKKVVQIKNILNGDDKFSAYS